MNNILAAQVLRSHYGEITDGAYKRATKIAISKLYEDAWFDWQRLETGLTACEYMGLTPEEYDFWYLEIEVEKQ